MKRSQQDDQIRSRVIDKPVIDSSELSDQDTRGSIRSFDSRMHLSLELGFQLWHGGTSVDFSFFPSSHTFVHSCLNYALRNHQYYAFP